VAKKTQNAVTRLLQDKRDKTKYYGLSYLHCSLLWNAATFLDWTLLLGTSAPSTVLWFHCGYWRKVRRKDHDTSRAKLKWR